MSDAMVGDFLRLAGSPHPAERVLPPNTILTTFNSNFLIRNTYLYRGTQPTEVFCFWDAAAKGICGNSWWSSEHLSGERGCGSRDFAEFDDLRCCLIGRLVYFVWGVCFLLYSTLH